MRPGPAIRLYDSHARQAPPRAPSRGGGCGPAGKLRRPPRNFVDHFPFSELWLHARAGAASRSYSVCRQRCMTGSKNPGFAGRLASSSVTHLPGRRTTRHIGKSPEPRGVLHGISRVEGPFKQTTKDDVLRLPSHTHFSSLHRLNAASVSRVRPVINSGSGSVLKLKHVLPCIRFFNASGMLFMSGGHM